MCGSNPSAQLPRKTSHGPAGAGVGDALPDAGGDVTLSPEDAGRRPRPDPALCDAAGTTHTPASGEARIVSLVPSITELLFDLGAGGLVAGRTPFCIHPRDGVANVPRVGGTKTPRLDRIRALEPTHVIVNVDENRREDADALAAFVPNVVVTHPLGPRDNPALYRLVGGIFASGEATDRLCRAFERAVSALESAARGLPPRRVLYLIWRDPWMTVSPDTYVSRTLALVNFTTAGGGIGGSRDGRRYPELALTPELLDGVDLVLLSSEPFPFKERHAAEIRAFAGARCPAVRLFDGEMASWYGSRAIRAMDYLGRFAAELGTRASRHPPALPPPVAPASAIPAKPDNVH